MKPTWTIALVGILLAAAPAFAQDTAEPEALTAADWVPAIVAGIFGVVVAFIGSVSSYLLAAKKGKEDLERLRREYQLEFAAERVARELMSHEKWTLRSFHSIKRHLSGFKDDNDLRKVLIGAGAISFESKNGKEMWGLFERTKDRLGQKTVEDDPEDVETDPGVPTIS